MTHDITQVPLTDIEALRLANLEDVVERGLDTFVNVGNALAEIRDSKLYRQTHDNFADYLDDRFGISRQRGYQLIDAANLSTMVDNAGLPPIRNERQARALSGLNNQQVLEAYQIAVADSAGRPTARAITEAREQVAPKSKPEPTARPLPGPKAPNRRRGTQYRDPNNFISLVTNYGGAGVLQQQFDSLDWSRLDRAAVAEFKENIARLRKLLDQLEDAMTTALSATESDEPVVSRPRGRRPITLYSKANSAEVGYEHAVAEAIKRLRIPAMPHRDAKIKRRQIPADRLDDLAAALEADGYPVQVVVE